MNPFEYVKAINNTKKDIMVDDIAEKEYNSFMHDRFLFYSTMPSIVALFLQHTENNDFP